MLRQLAAHISPYISLRLPTSPHISLHLPQVLRQLAAHTRLDERRHPEVALTRTPPRAVTLALTPTLALTLGRTLTLTRPLALTLTRTLTLTRPLTLTLSPPRGLLRPVGGLPARPVGGAAISPQP